MSKYVILAFKVSVLKDTFLYSSAYINW